eukprot:12236763-Prorocentrum_lima.AAC.1
MRSPQLSQPWARTRCVKAARLKTWLVSTFSHSQGLGYSCLLGSSGEDPRAVAAKVLILQAPDQKAGADS